MNADPVRRVLLAVLLIAAPHTLVSQERGAIALGEAVQGLGVNTRVLVIGAHPDDEDTFLIAWLSRGRHVETAYLSLTRGDGGQNLIGNELGEALGVIRTEELLAARRVDGAEQFFTRAFDFGFSKDTIDTYKHWPRDSILGDVIRVVRSFRPHVIVAVFSGTPRDGHGHHQVSALLARTAYDVAGDTVRYPVRTFGPAWTPLKFYRNARYDPTGGVTLRFDVGEYSPLLGRSYAEIAGESRSQHKSQGFGAPQRKGPFFDALRREATRVNEAATASRERSIFDGIDTTWTRFRSKVRRRAARAALDSIPRAFAAARTAFEPFAPDRLLGPLTRVQRLLLSVCDRQPGPENPCTRIDGGYVPVDADLERSHAIALSRVDRALGLAAGAALDVAAEREAVTIGGTMRVTSTFYNRSRDTVGIRGPWSPPSEIPVSLFSTLRLVPPGGLVRDSFQTTAITVTTLYWLQWPRVGATFRSIVEDDEQRMQAPQRVEYKATLPRTGAQFTVVQPLVYRFVDQVRGEIQRQVVGAPAIAITLDDQVQYAPANMDIDRELTVYLRSADPRPREVCVTLSLPAGITADSGFRSVRLDGYDAMRSVTFRIRGRLPAGAHRFAARAESDGHVFDTGYELVDYEHIRRQRIYRPAAMTLSAVDVQVPPTLKVAYISGVGDNVAPTLAQLGIPVTAIPANEVARADLQPYTTIVIGPRAYEAHPELVAANARLFEFARKGGTLVVQYGQYEMTQPGVMPYPITLARPADRVTEEDSPVTIEAPAEKVLRSPNRIGASDFAGWVQERALYMPRTFDEHYRAPLSMHDTGEPPNKAAILVAPLGEGLYIYTTLSLFRQLPAGVPGGARLFLNLLSAGLVSPYVSP
ncbi:MAG TPA: PIG-L family deacetylase [Gemmatimonadaceae bacterium]